MTTRLMLLACFLSAAVSLPCFSQQPRVRVLPDHDDSFMLTAAQIKANEIQALDGSQEAANKLANYYVGVVFDVRKGMEWNRVGAENGSPDAMTNYYTIALETAQAGDAEWLRRGKFWLKRAASMGDKYAIRMLKRDDPNFGTKP